jgi:hypothetical protein
MMRTRLHTKSATHPAAWFVDWHVAPGDRGVGVGLALLRNAEAAAGTLLTLQGSPDTRVMLPRLGWRQSEVPRTWTRPLSLRFIADWLGRRARVPHIAARAAAAYFRALPPAKIARFSLRPIAAFPSDYDAVWQQRAREFAPAMARDAAYLNYLAAEYPDDGYQLHLLVERERPVGHVITRLDDDGEGFRRARLVDLLWLRHQPELLQWLIQRAVADVSAAGADYVECVASVSDLTELLARERFFARRPVPIWYHRLPAGAPDPDTWYITYADCDRAYR